MSRRVILILSGVLAVLAVVMLQVWKANIARDLGVAGEGAAILVASRDLPAGTVLAEGDFLVAEYPRAYLPPRAVPASIRHDAVGQTLGLTIKAGQPLLSSDWTEATSIHKLSQRIPASLRGLALRVDNVSTFGGLLEPGDRVDIVVTWNTPDAVVETRTLLQNVAVAAVGAEMADRSRDAGRHGNRPGTVTVVVNAKEAEMLIFAEKQGELTLTLHRDKDLSIDGDLTRTTWFDDDAVKSIQDARQTRKQDCVIIQKANQEDDVICG